MSFTVFGALRELDEGRHRAEFYRGWSLGLEAGLPHPVSLEQIGRIASPLTDAARRYLLMGLQQGRDVSTLAKARPSLFHPFEIAMLAAGEESGKLGPVLRLLADHFGREYKRMLKVRGLMGYPIFVGVASAFVIGLPFLHRGGRRAYGWAVAASITAFLMLGGIAISLIATIFANGFRHAVPRFARVLAMCFEAGLPRGRAVRLAVDASGSSDIRALIVKRSERELNVLPLAKLFEGSRILPQEMIAQMSVADATGLYAETLRRYADELERAR